MVEINFTRGAPLISGTITQNVNLTEFYTPGSPDFNATSYLLPRQSSSYLNAVYFVNVLAAAVSATPNGRPLSKDNRFTLKIYSDITFDFTLVNSGDTAPLTLTSSHNFIDVAAIADLSVLHEDLTLAPCKENVTFVGPTFTVSTPGTTRDALFLLSGVTDMRFTGIHFLNDAVSKDKPIINAASAEGIAEGMIFTSCFFDIPSYSAAITNVLTGSATTTVVCGSNHGTYAAYSYVYIQGISGVQVSGESALNDRNFLAVATSATDLVLKQVVAGEIVDVDSSGFSAYVEAGSITFLPTNYSTNPIYVSPSGELPLNAEFRGCIFSSGFSPGRMSAEWGPHFNPIFDSCYFLGGGWGCGTGPDARFTNCVFVGYCFDGGGVTIAEGVVVDNCTFYLTVGTSGPNFKGTISHCKSYTAALAMSLYGTIRNCEFYNSKIITMESLSMVGSGAIIDSCTITTGAMGTTTGVVVVDVATATILNSVLTTTVGSVSVLGGGGYDRTLQSAGNTFDPPTNLITEVGLEPSMFKNVVSSTSAGKHTAADWLRDIRAGYGIELSSDSNKVTISATVGGGLTELERVDTGGLESPKIYKGYFLTVSDNGVGEIRVAMPGHTIVDGDVITIYGSSVAGYNATDVEVSGVVPGVSFDVASIPYSATATGYIVDETNTYIAQDQRLGCHGEIKSIFLLNWPVFAEASIKSGVLYPITMSISSIDPGSNAPSTHSGVFSYYGGSSNRVNLISNSSGELLYYNQGRMVTGVRNRIDYVDL